MSPRGSLCSKATYKRDERFNLELIAGGKRRRQLCKNSCARARIPSVEVKEKDKPQEVELPEPDVALLDSVGVKKTAWIE